jgi:hypothetical protein
MAIRFRELSKDFPDTLLVIRTSIQARLQFVTWLRPFFHERLKLWSKGRMDSVAVENLCQSHGFGPVAEETRCVQQFLAQSGPSGSLANWKSRGFLRAG